MFTIFVNQKSGFDAEYVCEGLDSMRFLTGMLEESKRVENYCVLDFGSEYKDEFFVAKKRVSIEVFRKGFFV